MLAQLPSVAKPGEGQAGEPVGLEAVKLLFLNKAIGPERSESTHGEIQHKTYDG